MLNKPAVRHKTAANLGVPEKRLPTLIRVADLQEGMALVAVHLPGGQEVRSHDPLGSGRFGPAVMIVPARI